MSKQNLGEDKIYSKVCVSAASTNLQTIYGFIIYGFIIYGLV